MLNFITINNFVNDFDNASFFHSDNISMQCIIWPLKPSFFIVKLWYAMDIQFFLHMNQNIYCGYLLEPPRRGASGRGGSNVYPQSVF